MPMSYRGRQSEAIRDAVNRLGLQNHWVIMRHGGRTNCEWRDITRYPADYQYGAEKSARDLYQCLMVDVRQGGLALVNPSGEIVAFYSAPLVRTRW
jgi:hypothetical protein